MKHAPHFFKFNSIFFFFFFSFLCRRVPWLLSSVNAFAVWTFAFSLTRLHVLGWCTVTRALVSGLGRKLVSYVGSRCYLFFHNIFHFGYLTELLPPFAYIGTLHLPSTLFLFTSFALFMSLAYEVRMPVQACILSSMLWLDLISVSCNWKTSHKLVRPKNNILLWENFTSIKKSSHRHCLT